MAPPAMMPVPSEAGWINTDGGTMLADHGMMEGAVLQGHLDHLFACFFHRLGDGDRHFAGLALAHADTAVVIADHGQGGEAENPATLHHLGDAVDRDHLLLQAIALLFLLLYGSRHDLPRLKLQTVFAGRFGQSLDTTVEGEAGAVEGNLLDTDLLGLFSDTLADQLGSATLPPFLICSRNSFRRWTRRSAHATGRIDNLRINVRIAAMYTLNGSHPAPRFWRGFCAPCADAGSSCPLHSLQVISSWSL
jgi:hypothetical protein